MAQANHTREKLYSLQYIRAVAALVVVGFHVCSTGALGLHPAPGLLLTLRVLAACAVDIFFILSGFIMVYTQANSPKSARLFAAQRIARIVPLYWITTLGFGLFLILADPASHGAGDMLAHFKASKGYIATSMMFVSHLAGYQYPVVLPGWSLEYEMLFYAIFTAAIFISARYDPTGSHLASGSLISPDLSAKTGSRSLSSGSGARNTVLVAVAVLAALVMGGILRPLCLEFAVGAGVAVLYLRGGHRPLAAGLLLVAPAVVIVGLLGGFYARVNDSDLCRLAFCGVPMLGLFAIALCLPQRRRPALLMLGDCSYAIYVSHCAWLAVFVRFILPALPQALGPVAILIGGSAWSVAGGIALHYAVEHASGRPRQRRARTQAERQNRPLANA